MEADSPPVIEHEDDTAAFECMLDIAQRSIVRNAAARLQRRNGSLSDHGQLGQFLLAESKPNTSCADLLFVNHVIEL